MFTHIIHLKPNPEGIPESELNNIASPACYLFKFLQRIYSYSSLISNMYIDKAITNTVHCQNINKWERIIAYFAWL